MKSDEMNKAALKIFFSKYFLLTSDSKGYSFCRGSLQRLLSLLLSSSRWPVVVVLDVVLVAARHAARGPASSTPRRPRRPRARGRRAVAQRSLSSFSLSSRFSIPFSQNPKNKIQNTSPKSPNEATQNASVRIGCLLSFFDFEGWFNKEFDFFFFLDPRF